MRLISLSILVAIVISYSCRKNTQPGYCKTYFTINSAITPRNTTVAAGITTIVQGFGSTGCHEFSGSEVTNRLANNIEIRLKGTVPCGVPICPAVLIGATDTIKIPTPATGIYYLKFFSATVLLKTDTVIVN